MTSPKTTVTQQTNISFFTQENPDYSMRAFFHDTNLKVDYDRKIEDTRSRMQTSCNPCQSLREMQTLVNSIKTGDLPRYYSRPCIEGFCWSSLFSFMTPHRSRINRRIQTLEQEIQSIHQPDCNMFLMHKKEEQEREQALKSEQQKLNAEIEKARIEAEARTKSEEQTTTIKRGWQ